MTYSKISKIFRIVVLVSVLLTPYISNAQTVKAGLDSNMVEFGNPVKFQISAFVTSGQKVAFPVFKDSKILPDLEVLSELKPDTFVNGKEVQFTHTYFITSFKDSVFMIPSLPVRVGKDTLYTDSLQVTFTLLQDIDSSFTAEIDTTKMIKIFDIKPVKEAPWTFEEFWARFGHTILIILFVVIITALLTYIYIRWKNNKPIIPISKPKEPADKVAFRELDKLKAEKIWQSGRSKEYYSRLTEILKTYISDRYSNSVMELTSDETLSTLKNYMEPKSESFQNLKFIFGVADFVKFAKLEPDPNDNINSLDCAFKFVESTKLVVNEPDKKDAAVTNLKTKEGE